MHWIDPDCLPEILVRVERILVNPRGEPDGLILADGAEVHFPPHMGADVSRAFAGAREAIVKIRGVRPRDGDVFAAVSLQWPGEARIEDRGPPNKPHKPGKGEKPAPVERHEQETRTGGEARAWVGTVRRALHGAKGERRGVLLESGQIVRFPPHAAEVAGEVLRPGAPFAARGEALETAFGLVMEAAHLGEDAAHLQRVERPKKAKPHPERPEGRRA